MTIYFFSGQNRFLSNFYPSSITVGDYRFPCVENAYQASKSSNPIIWAGFTNISAAEAKRMGRGIALRDDWDLIKVRIMQELLLKKFEDPELRGMLIGTGSQELIEGNTWGDRFWGVCDGVGENMLGKLLMGVRNFYLRQEWNG